ncbi:cell division protein FtsZ [Candidatus Dojkabacteria bacterium]|nr:cell division protein FtsZ [Candidatus Dojkabacteria bacterium]
MLVTPTVDPVARIKAVGVGGGGGNAINTMISQYNIEGVDFVSVNTDVQALHNSLAPVTVPIGETLTKGLGSGGDWVTGQKAAEESIDQLQEVLAGSDMVFITAGMGGGTGTGAAPVIGKICKEMGALTVAIVTKPFKFEGQRRMDVALEGIENLKGNVDTLITIPNQRLLEIIDKNISFLEAMRKVDEVLAQAVRSISSLVTQTGYVNVDFADVKSIMRDSGSALMGMGSASGENRAEQAAKMATTSPLLNMSMDGATGVLLDIVGGPTMSMHEIDTIAEMVQGAADPSANVIFGASLNEDMGDELQVIVLATGFDEGKQRDLEKGQDLAEPIIKSGGVNLSAGKISSTVSDDDEDMDDLDKPAFLRRNK